MNINGFGSVRISDLSRGAGASAVIQRTQARLAQVQQQLTTGRRLLRPSDATGDASVAMQLRKTLEARAGYSTTLEQGRRYLADADQVFSDVTDLVREIRTIAQANLSTGITNNEQEGAAQSLRALERQILGLANRQSGGMSLFGGQATGDAYIDDGGAVRFVGTQDTLSNLISENVSLHLLASGQDTFGGYSERVGTATLTPAIAADTRLSAISGARDNGIGKGAFRIINAGTAATIDLADADDLGDVVNKINASGIGVTASLTGNALQLTGAAITVEEAGGTAAGDLGLLQAPGATITGDPLNPRITPFTPLAALNGGAGIDLAGGFTLTNGQNTDTVSLAGVMTVGDLLARLNEQSPTAVKAQISDDGSTLELLNPVQGLELRVAEGSGTTAADLGWLTFTANDKVSDFNGGRGLRLDPDKNDLSLTDTSDLRFEVKLGASGSTQDVIDAINAAATAAGSTLTAAFDPGAPGIVLNNVQQVANVGESRAAIDLGLDQPITGGTMTGRDVNPVTSEGLFGHLKTLINALDNGDITTAEKAIADLEADEARVVRQRAEAGSRLREIESRLDRLEDQNPVTVDVLS